MLTEASKDHRLFSFGSESCQLRAVVVGGGGDSHDNGGGGSGYINNILVSMPNFNQEIQVNIGDIREESMIKINNHETFRAE